ncbi:M23 family metallopeptidase [Ruania zhangjianzhongii]|uniref:M23 family metallopeptidase n=1 Tax=Ruania zhangjianzhongii TaxID=2603206 RepID=UPI0011C9BE41|nr:M23 family metallopeptidase [Ruania zhangjianzhongii]
MGREVVLHLPFAGRSLVQMSPARRVPSHGTDLMGSRYAIDFVGVDAEHRLAAVTDWRTYLGTEPPERFVSFGRPVLAPCGGEVVATCDGEEDHEARRSPITLLGYALTQASRVRAGIPAIAGNYVTIADEASGAFITLVHLRRDSLRVAVGTRVRVGEVLAECGNSGNSTSPCVHVQASDRSDFRSAVGVPLTFHSFREWHTATTSSTRHLAVPDERTVVEPVPPPAG